MKKLPSLHLSPILIEEFLSNYVNIIQEEKRYLLYSLKPEEIKFLLMRNAEFIDNIDYAIEYLIRSDEIRTNNNSSLLNSQISFNNLQTKLEKCHTLAQNRIIDFNEQVNINEINFIVKPIESVLINNQPAYYPDTLIYSYSALIMIARSKYEETKSAKKNPKFQDLGQLIDLYNSYSLQSNFSPINPKLIQQQNSENGAFNPLFIGIPSGSPNLHQKGMASNGHFLFFLHSDMYLSIFPISIENGGFLSPFMCKLKISSDIENASLSFLANRLILNSPHLTLSFGLSSLIVGQSSTYEMKCPEVQTKIQALNKDSGFVVTDGVVNVYISQQKEMTIATVKTIETQKEINKVVLHRNENFSYKTYPFDNGNGLFLWPVETNGIVLSFYIKIDQSHTLCRQFSLIDGSHLKDDMIETTITISSITYDSINQMHYVAIENNGQLMVYALSGMSNCSVNPFIFDFSIPDFDGKKNLKTKIISIFSNLGSKNIKDENKAKDNEFVSLFSSIVLSSIFFKKDINTFIINDIENILLLPLFIVEISKAIYENIVIDKDKDISSNDLKISAIQNLAILFVINMRHQYMLMNDENSDKQKNSTIKAKFQTRVVELLLDLSRIKEAFSMNIITYIILNLFDLIDICGKSENETNFQAILEGLLISSSSTLLNYIIHVLIMNSDKFSLLSFNESTNVFSKYIVDNYSLSQVHPGIISFLLCHQRCVINEVHRSMKKDHFATSSLIININYTDCKTDNEALNNFGEYTNFLVNQFSSSITSLSSFEEMKNTTIYFLFLNYLSLIAGLYNYHEIAQIVTPLLFITQNSIKEFFERSNVVLSKNQEAQDILTKIGLAFGACTGTLIKGGNYSKFDEKYKWLIRPNMNLISHPDLLYDLDNPSTNINSFLDQDVRLFLSSSPDLNGKEILQNIYKKWNVNMNKNLRSPLLELDQLFFAVELYHLHLFEELKEGKIDLLRPALQQMMRVRNTARAILRSNDSSRKVEILATTDENNDNNNDKSDSEENNSYYSPFDLIVVKCKMLLRMTSKFDNSNVSIAPKLLADFVLSPDQPSAMINYISNQQNRLQLTNVGFSLIEAAYSLKIDELFLQVIDTTLSIVVDNFDGLSAIVQYDDSQKSEKQISNFLSRAFESMKSSYLALIVYKLIKSETLSNEIIGRSIEKVLTHAIDDNKLFGLCYKRFGYITNIFENCDSFSFLDSSKNIKVPLISLPVEDFYKISINQWFIISDVLSTRTNDSKIYQKILQFFIDKSFGFSITEQTILHFISKCIFSFYERFDETYSLQNVKNDFELLLKLLGNSLTTHENLIKASEIVTFFRRILMLCNKFTLILVDIFKHYESLLSSPAQKNYSERICAIFSILGGFIDVIKLNYPVSFRYTRETIKQGIFLDQGRLVEYPINEETKPIYYNGKNIYAEPIVPFNWCMFPDFNFILTFLNYATKVIPSQLSLIYLTSLSYYLKEETFYNSLLDSHIDYLIKKLSSFMNPFDTIKDTKSIITFLMVKKKIQPLKECGFSIMSNESLQCETFLSPVLKSTKVDVVIESNPDFEGYFGIIADCPIENQFPYAFINAKSGNVYPGSLKSHIAQGIKSNIIRFSVDAVQQSIYVNQGTKSQQTIIRIPEIPNKTFNFKIFICCSYPCQVLSIKVKNSNSKDYNTKNQFNMNYVPHIYPIYSPSKKAPIVNYPSWTKYKTIQQLKNILMDDNNTDIFHPLTTDSYTKTPVFEMINFKYFIFRFIQADSISVDLIHSISLHVYSKLITQTSTIIMMYLVNNGFGQILLNYKPSLLIQLFSYLQIPLEPYDKEKLANIEFPFSFNESILNERSLVTHNQQFNDMEFDMKKCLHAIASIKHDDTFIKLLKSYIENMGNDPNVHTLRNINANCVHFDLVYLGPSLSIVIPSNEVETIITSTPNLDTFQINKIDRHISSKASPIHFPFIYDVNDNSVATININVSPLKSSKKTITCLSIDKNNNHWTFGTPFELLLLLKEYYILSNDPIFVREKLVNWMLINSPFISIFLPKLLLQCSQESFIIPSQVQVEYLQSLLCLSSLINTFNNFIDQNLSNFLFQEKRSLNSSFHMKISSYFPEFYLRPPLVAEETSPILTLQLPNLDIPSRISNPVSSFMLYKSLINRRESIRGFPYWEVLPIWLSITTKLLPLLKDKKQQNKKSENQEDSEDDLIVINKSNGFFEVINPMCQKAFVMISDSSKNNISTNIDSFILYSYSDTFDEPTIVNSNELFKPFEFQVPSLFISVNNIEGDIEFIAQVDEQYNESDDEDEPQTSYDFNLLKIHDDFVNDMTMLVENWTDEETYDLISIIPPFLLQQASFQPLFEIVLSPDMNYNSYFPPRVVLIVTFVVHRINNLNYSYHDSISQPMWNSVNNLISFNEASKKFLSSILRKNTSRAYVDVNRFEAHRVAIEGNGSQAMSVICQMSRLLADSATKLRSPEMVWHVKFINEEAIDVGGPSRELFSEISMSIFEPTSGLFILGPNGLRKYGDRYRDVYVPFHYRPPHSRLIEIDSIRRNTCYKAIGVFLGIVMRVGYYQNLPFAPLVWKLIANEKVGEKDVLEIDQRFADFIKNLRKAKNNKDKSIFNEQFNSNSNRLSWACENWDGSTMKVPNPTKSNFVLREHVDLYIVNCIKKRIEVLLESVFYIRQGMCENIGFSHHQFMTGKIISFLTQGSNVITTMQLKKIFLFPEDEELKIGSKGYFYFWEAVERMTNNQRSLLLKFITALTRLPNPATFKDFKIKVSPLSARTNCLPQASTCFNTLYLPVYTSSEIAFKMITIAIESCQTMEKS